MKKTDRIPLTDLQYSDHRALRRSASVIAGVAAAITLIAGCAMIEQEPADVTAPPVMVDVSNVPNATPKELPMSKYGNPVSYVVAGKRYYTMPTGKGYSETGIASWYGTEAQGKRTSSGEIYDNYGMTAAHRTLPLPSFVKVTNKQNGRTVIVKVNDRGPFRSNRLIDLSYVAAVKLGIIGYGTGLVEVTAIDPAEYDGNGGPIIREASADDAVSTLASSQSSAAKESVSTADDATRVAAMDAAKAADEAAESATVAAETTEARNRWKFWQWRPGKTQAAADTAKDSSSSVAELATEKVQAESEALAAPPEIAEKSSRWKFWQRKADTTAEESVASSAAETVAASATEAAATATQATSESAVMAGKTAAATTGGSRNLWKFWTRGKTDNETASAASEELPATAPEAVASAADIAEPAADARTSRWKFWQRWTKKDPSEAATPAEADTAIAALEEVEVETTEPTATAVRKVRKTKQPVAPQPPVVQLAREDQPGVYLQTGAFRLRENAERLRADVNALSPGAFNVVETTGMRTLYKIQIGPLQDKEEAARIARRLKSIGISPKLMDSGSTSTMLASRKTYRAQQPALAPVERAPAVREKAAPVLLAAAVKPAEAVANRPMKPLARPPEMPLAQIQSAREAFSAPAIVDRPGSKGLHQQAGAFAIRKNAVRLRTRIIDETMEPTGIFEEPADVTNDGMVVNLHKVQVGPLRNRREAMKIKRALEPLGIRDSFPVYRER